ncbi:MAG: hypothetical protein QM270_09255 [Bacillota bacterium]|nr:hypothetical protein [Bacillota bacterium]
MPYKAKAWLELSGREGAGGNVDSRDIRKHKNDAFRLTDLLDRNHELLQNVPFAISKDMKIILERMAVKNVNLRQPGIPNKTKETLLEELRSLYGKNSELPVV